ncbi:hypothetical protein JOF53_001061 [Crossiella equi]|uniref:Uncharacterized protein n=1 Tax=Crossiella equi TaxID=130796 RepID=A0ABS5A6G5_9PSEU|nr:hypothetical protein [Crossiella equi]MBP2472189.1 hypothetical protein [Crossiella equi]
MPTDLHRLRTHGHTARVSRNDRAVAGMSGRYADSCDTVHTTAETPSGVMSTSAT